MKSISSLFFGLIAMGLGWVVLQVLSQGGLNLNNLNLPNPPGGQSGQYTGYGGWGGNVPPASAGETIRIGAFNIQDFGEKKAGRPEIMELLARIVRQFDVLVIEEISSRNYDVVRELVDLANRDRSQFDYVLGPRVGRGNQKEQFAFIFDRASIEVARDKAFVIDDPSDRVAREPLVAWFRARGPRPEEAFTFALVSVHTDPDDVPEELDALADAWRAVRSNDWQEDDVIILGDFNANGQNMRRLGAIPGMAAAIPTTLPTNTRGNAQYDNLLFQHPATREFTGRAGVLDFVREYNLSLENALLVSDHLPVWAEFSIYENGQPGRVAAQGYQRY